MSYVRHAVLGDAWSDYVAQGGGPPGGRVTSPNGDVVVFDANGSPDYTIPRAGGVTDSTVEKDPASPFYGMTALQQAAFYSVQGVPVLTDALRAKGTYVDGSGVASYSAADVAANTAKLAALAASDAKVTAALATLTTGAYGSDVAARSAAAETANAAQLRRDAQAALQAFLAAGAVFSDTLKPGFTYTDDFLRGMISTTQWVEDWISVANGGKPTNANAAAGKIPAGAHTYSNTPNVHTSIATTTSDGTPLPYPSGGDDAGGASSPSSKTLLIGAAAVAAVFVLPSLFGSRR
ncbi:MAG: hypothetical protein ABJF01_17565 [bacterium]